ncbi:MAG: hypothetical protein JXD23_11730 [Spirochaetales bacterium]|nr:hypothetical protein [Spirochaetales bacterium]
MPNMTCSDIRERLQDAHDRGAAMDEGCADHLSACEACRVFQEFLTTYPERLRRELDTLADGSVFSAARTAEPGRVGKRRRRIGYSLSGLAAAVVIGLGILFAVFTVERVRTDRYVREENSRFVDDLFNDSVFDGTAYFTVSE